MKKIIAIVLIVIACLAFCGCSSNFCNKQIVDLNYKFDYAIVQRYDGEQIIHIKTWTDFDDGEQIQIIDTDGNVWLLNSMYTILVKEAK